MPRFTDNDNMEQQQIPGGNFSFSGVRTEHLGASDYTLTTIAVDVTGSTEYFTDDLLNCLKSSVEACRKSPRSENLLVRVIIFSDRFPNGIEEVHGFKPLSEIDTDKDYEPLRAGGNTPLIDAAYSSAAATNLYAKKLSDDEYPSNGILIITTDGGDNASLKKASAVKKELRKGVEGEYLESMLSILIGINTAQCGPYLNRFKDEAGIDHYIDAGEVTPGKLAKIAEFIGQSVSSQSQAMGTGGPSQNVNATI